MITESYLSTTASRIASDVDEFKANGDTVSIQDVDTSGGKVTITTEQVFFNDDITLIEILDSNGDKMYEKETNLITSPQKRIGLSVEIEITAVEKVEGGE